MIFTEELQKNLSQTEIFKIRKKKLAYLWVNSKLIKVINNQGYLTLRQTSWPKCLETSLSYIKQT